ncbi:unnamed protein product [Cylicocyclus nassatus]|uniref:Uncharacterized protein n=1 Tax=Cylicocyclus nassatus TaxID=53992 RepID=A0AA36M6H0_CYLNA|nr:unnamed protein product [Cylicocyclus nassatus]
MSIANAVRREAQDEGVRLEIQEDEESEAEDERCWRTFVFHPLALCLRMILIIFHPGLI